jgi:CRISPR-associated protein Csb3
LLRAIATAPLKQINPEDEFSSPIESSGPFDLRLDWWNEEESGKRLKPWAGSMRGFRIATAMQSVMQFEELQTKRLLDVGKVVYDPRELDKKVEPFYFDARRGSTARPIDIGFSPDALQMKSVAYPAVEFLCLAGLQRCRPRPTESPRVFEYFAWSAPLATCVAPLAACGVLVQAGDRGFRFENSFRTDQRKHKGFTTATLFARERP